MADVTIVDAELLLLAAVRRQATAQTIGRLITSSGVWELMKAQGIRSLGHNVVVYWAQPDARLTSPGGIAVDIGADVAEPFAGRDGLLCIKTPTGRAVHLKHVGPYARLGDSYEAMARYAHAHRLSIAGPFWEVYGHWTEDQDRLETDLYHLIVQGPS